VIAEALNESQILESNNGVACAVRRLRPLPPPRRVVCNGHMPGAPRLKVAGGSSEDFTIMTYNILADHLATNRMFPHANTEVSIIEMLSMRMPEPM